MNDRSALARPRLGRLSLVLSWHAVRHPGDGRDLLRLVWAFRRRDWWRLPPFLPVPDPAYFAWRMETAYGDTTALPSPEEIIAFARWRRETIGL